jgi:enolase
MVAPISAATFAEAVRMGSEIFHTLRRDLIAAGHNTGAGDEGGFAPQLRTADEALEFVLNAIERTGYKPGADVTLVMDSATSEFHLTGWRSLTTKLGNRSLLHQPDTAARRHPHRGRTRKLRQVRRRRQPRIA